MNRHSIHILACRHLLLDKLQKGTTVVVDRYTYSGAVYTAAKRLPGMDLDWAKVSAMEVQSVQKLEPGSELERPSTCSSNIEGWLSPVYGDWRSSVRAALSLSFTTERLVFYVQQLA